MAVRMRHSKAAQMVGSSEDCKALIELLADSRNMGTLAGVVDQQHELLGSVLV